MTVDALLAIALNVAIPCVLAILGGILAVRSLQSNTREKLFWVCSFIGIALIAIVLAFVQQVRLSEQIQKNEQIATAKEQKLTGEQKYTQGQLDSINKVLTAVVSNESTGSQQKVLLTGLLAAVKERPPQSNEPQAVANAALKEETFAVARKIREFAESTGSELQRLNEERRRELAAPGLTEEQKAEISRRHANLLNSYIRAGQFRFIPIQAQAQQIQKLLLNRLPPQQPGQWGESALQYTNLNTLELIQLSLYFEKLARQLPQ